MIILGIETSCDDTGAAVYDGKNLLSSVISTQGVHRQFGGVVPELASRQHIRHILPMISEALAEAGIGKKNLQGIAVTYGPGLAGSLLVGLSVAKGMAMALKIPMAGINHLEGHIWANALQHPGLQPPFIVLIVSGGHTQIVRVHGWGNYAVMGRTRDDAAGEAFDKVAKLLGLGYPGGPAIEKKASQGNPVSIRFPRAYLGNASDDFSFSGIKTAVLHYVQSLGPGEKEARIPDICASFQEAVVEVLAEKTVAAARKARTPHICLAGGVAVNGRLQNRMKERCSEESCTLHWPDAALCTDNAGMIAMAGHYYLSRHTASPMTLAPAPSLNL